MSALQFLQYFYAGGSPEALIEEALAYEHEEAMNEAAHLGNQLLRKQENIEQVANKFFEPSKLTGLEQAESDRELGKQILADQEVLTEALHAKQEELEYHKQTSHRMRYKMDSMTMALLNAPDPFETTIAQVGKIVGGHMTHVPKKYQASDLRIPKQIDYKLINPTIFEKGSII